MENYITLKQKKLIRIDRFVNLTGFRITYYKDKGVAYYKASSSFINLEKTRTYISYELAENLLETYDYEIVGNCLEGLYRIKVFKSI